MSAHCVVAIRWLSITSSEEFPTLIGSGVHIIYPAKARQSNHRVIQSYGKPGALTVREQKEVPIM